MKTLLMAAFSAIAFAAAPISQAETKPTTLKFANFAGPTAFLTKGMFEPLFEKIEADSEGTLKIQMFSGASLVKAEDTFDAVRRGLVDMGWGVTGYTPGRFKVAGIPEIPFEAYTLREASHGLWRLYEEGLVDGLDSVHVFGFVSSGILSAHSVKAVKSLDDFKGERVRAAGSSAAAAMNALGVIPVGLPVPVIAENLSKKTLTGSLNDWNAVFTWQILDFVKWHIDAPMGSSSVFLIINKKVYEKLPEPAKAALRKHGGAHFVEYWSERLGNENERLRQDIASRPDHVIIKPSEKDLQRWRKAVAPVVSEWAASVPHGERVLQIYRDEIQAVRKQK